MSDQIRIAILFEYASLNGGEHSMLAALDELRTTADFEFVAITPAEGPLVEQLRERGIESHTFAQRGSDGIRLSADDVRDQLKSIVNRIRPTILHANSLAMGRLTGSIAADLSCHCTSHLRDIIKVSKSAMADLNRNAGLAAVSNATRDFHIDHGMDPARVVTVYNGVDLDQFQPRPKTGSLITELGLPDDAFVVLTVGQIGLRKGLDVLAAAAVDVCRQTSNVHFVIVGERHSQKAESVEFDRNLEARLNEAGFANRWHRLGRRNDVAKLMNEANLLAHAAHQEPLGRVLLEAASSGLPIVATNVGGTNEILEDSVSGILVPPRDRDALAAAICQRHANPQQNDTLQRAARQVMVERFAIKMAAANLVTFWREANAPIVK